MGSDYGWEREAASAPVGSVEAERMLEQGVEELAEKLQEEMATFVAEPPEAD